LQLNQEPWSGHSLVAGSRVPDPSAAPLLLLSTTSER
jgi:hypothetical protein